MNSFEKLYDIQKDIENEIKKHQLFENNVYDAIELILQKIGVLSMMGLRATPELNNNYIKKIVETNASYIDENSFYQESLKWLCRWCIKYCNTESSTLTYIAAEEIYGLMGKAYAYEFFCYMCDLHSRKKVKCNIIDKMIEFEYTNEKTYAVHSIYEMWNKEMCTKIDISKSLRAMGNSWNEQMRTIHNNLFKCKINFNFGKFNLQEYKAFSAVINEIIIQKISNKVNKGVYIIIPGEEGIIKCPRQQLVNYICKKSELSISKIENIIDFFLLDLEDKNSDISLQYIIPSNDKSLAISEEIFNLSNIEDNALRLLAKKGVKEFNEAQTEFELYQKQNIRQKIDKKYKIALELDREKSIRPGMDLLVYDQENNYLQVIELKYKIPIESSRDLDNLDKLLTKAYLQLEEAKKYVNGNKETILQEYFGNAYIGIVPEYIDFFVVTNFSAGTGYDIDLPSPILVENHYIQLMKYGMKEVNLALRDACKKLFSYIEKQNIIINLGKYKMQIPEYRSI